MRHLSEVVRRHKPIVLPPKASVQEACRCMHNHRVGAILIAEEDGRLLGIFTGRDAVNRILAAGKSAAKTRLGEVMTADPVTMPPHQTAIEALRLMWDGGFRHVPIVHEGKILGVVSKGDFKGDEQDRLEAERELWERI